MIFPQPLKAASFARVMAAPLSLLENPRPATRVAGRKTASGIFLRRPPARARKNRSQVAQLRRVKKPAATKTASGRGFWTATDPIGFRGGLNLYTFVGNYTIGVSDPFGLCPCTDTERNQIRAETDREISDIWTDCETGLTGINERYSSLRSGLEEGRDGQLALLLSQRNWEMEACSQAYPSNGPLDTALRLSCMAGVRLFMNPQDAFVWAAYGTGVAALNVAQLGEASVLSLGCNSRVRTASGKGDKRLADCEFRE